MSQHSQYRIVPPFSPLIRNHKLQKLIPLKNLNACTTNSKPRRQSTIPNFHSGTVKPGLPFDFRHIPRNLLPKAAHKSGNPATFLHKSAIQSTPFSETRTHAATKPNPTVLHLPPSPNHHPHIHNHHTTNPTRKDNPFPLEQNRNPTQCNCSPVRSDRPDNLLIHRIQAPFILAGMSHRNSQMPQPTTPTHSQNKTKLADPGARCHAKWTSDPHPDAWRWRSSRWNSEREGSLGPRRGARPTRRHVHGTTKLDDDHALELAVRPRSMARSPRRQAAGRSGSLTHGAAGAVTASGPARVTAVMRDDSKPRHASPLLRQLSMIAILVSEHPASSLVWNFTSSVASRFSSSTGVDRIVPILDLKL